MLDSEQRPIHELSPGRSQWLHVVLGEDVPTAGDGAGFSDERAVSYTAREESEILLFDLCGEKGETVVNVSTVRFVRWDEEDYHEAGPVPKAFYGFGG